MSPNVTSYRVQNKIVGLISLYYKFHFLYEKIWHIWSSLRCILCFVFVFNMWERADVIILRYILCVCEKALDIEMFSSIIQSYSEGLKSVSRCFWWIFLHAGLFVLNADKATSQLLLETDWESILQICDLIRQGDTQ